MAYFLLSLDPDSTAIYIQRYATKAPLLKAMRGNDLSPEDFAMDTDIGDAWDSENPRGAYRYIIIKGEILTPFAKKIIEEVDIS